MCYADDTQVYVSFKPCDLHVAISQVEKCVKEIKQWSVANGLKLNDEKTEILHLSSRFRRRMQFPVIKIDDTSIVPSRNARNLGVIFDENMILNKFVLAKCKSASFALCKLGRIRQVLDAKTTKKLVQALVTCHLDYCNSLLFNLPDSQLNKLQVIQNSAARLITRTKKHSHITPVLKRLHWLPIQSRVMFKVLLLTYQCLHAMAPKYLSECLMKYIPSRNLRSAQKDLLQCPSIQTRFYGERSFAHAAPSLWNIIPSYLKNSSTTAKFKSNLKTYLFKKYFE